MGLIADWVVFLHVIAFQILFVIDQHELLLYCISFIYDSISSLILIQTRKHLVKGGGS